MHHAAMITVHQIKLENSTLLYALILWQLYMPSVTFLENYTVYKAPPPPIPKKKQISDGKSLRSDPTFSKFGKKKS